MIQRKLILSIVPGGQGNAIARAANDAGAAGGTLLQARGTATRTFLALLGLGDSDRDIAFTVVEAAVASAVCDAIRAYFPEHPGSGSGILLSLDVLDFARSGDPLPSTGSKTGDSEMPHETAPSQVIHVIVNKNYADEAMAAARKAGARGGTVLRARGTARPEDGTFFGVPLVPEKEMLIIHVESCKADDVFQAIRSLPCFAEKGSGVIFRLPVSEFALLGN